MNIKRNCILIFVSFAFSFLGMANVQVELNEALINTTVYDKLNPPQVSRIFAYSNVAYYEVLGWGSEAEKSLGNILKDYPKFKKIRNKNINKIDKDYAAALIFMEVSSSMIYSHKRYKANLIPIFEKIKKGIRKKKIKRTEKFVAQFLKEYLEWCNSDGFKNRLALKEYEVKRSDSLWTPTPPSFFDPIEPHWKTLRLFFSDMEQFSWKPSFEFSYHQKKEFYKELIEVYEY